ncbi:MAG: uracil phosphoribosyltransferase [Planctomycetes bacterium]|jgi:uracil phosphoribosyltransferase|nr:uracil phosphoribosyltransferase [Planctomycetota bacterium]
MSKTIELHHPLAKHHLAILRDQNTPSVLFRNQIRLLSMLLAVRATEDLSLSDFEIDTPLTRMRAQRIAQRIAIIPILRAGLGLVDPILELIPSAEVWHLGMYRDEETAKPIEYYCKLPKDDPAQVGFVLDPMLATGGSIRVAVAALKRWGVRDVRVLSVIAAPEGIRALHEEHPDVSIYVGAVDQELNDQKFIVPGLGDAGDRIFNTKR